MRKKQMVILIVVLAAIVVALLAVFIGKKYQANKAEEEAEAETIYVGAFTPADVTEFSINSGDELLQFDLDGDTWVYAADTDMEMDADSIETFLTSMGSVTATNVIEDVEDASDYGIDDPTTVFGVVFSDGSDYVFTFGEANDILGGYYVQLTGAGVDDTVYLVSSSVVTSTLSKTAEDFQVEEEDDEDTSE